MREIKYKGKTAYITEGEWKSLCNRFNPKGLEKGKRRHYGCVLCKKYRFFCFCDDCPLCVFQEGYTGCSVILNKFLKGHIGMLGVYWIKYDSDFELKCITKIYNALKKLKKVKRKK